MAVGETQVLSVTASSNKRATAQVSHSTQTAQTDEPGTLFQAKNSPTTAILSP